MNASLTSSINVSIESHIIAESDSIEKNFSFTFSEFSWSWKSQRAFVDYSYRKPCFFSVTTGLTSSIRFQLIDIQVQRTIRLRNCLSCLLSRILIFWIQQIMLMLSIRPEIGKFFGPKDRFFSLIKISIESVKLQCNSFNCLRPNCIRSKNLGDFDAFRHSKSCFSKTTR